METFNGAPKSKNRPNLSIYSTNYMYHNVARNFRPFGSEYAVPHSNGRRSVASMHYSRPCSEQPSRLMSPVDLAKKSRNGKYCSIALAIASLIVLVTILAIAGLALHMGILYTDTTNPLITFSCTARILKGDRFVGPLQDKARRYKRQFEALYQRSILGQSFVSCVVDKFGDDAQTVYFKLAFNRKKLTKNPSSVEKAIKDILLTDAISRNSVFKNVRFDPKHVTVSQILENNFYQASSYSSNPSEKKQYTPTPSSGGVIRKLLNKSTNANAKKSSPPVSIGRNNDDIGPGVHGSFKISKTDADITEKKSESVPNRSHSIDKSTSHSNKKKLMNETSITSTLYKVSEKVTKSEPSTSSTTPVSSTTKSTTITTKQEITTPEYVPTAPVFVKNPFDTEPWIPIINHHLFLNPFTQSASPRTEREPIYTSFTNPSLSSHFSNDKRLGPINFRGHPLPVNKIPITEATIPGTLDSKLSNDYGTSELEGHVDENNNSKFIEIETLEHIPQRNRPELVPEETVVPEVTETTVDHSKSSVAEEPVISGQGQVEVVIDDSYDLLHTPHTTKIPLVTLLPVKSNSGIGRPMRRRPNEMYKLQKSDEHRTFSGSSEVITSSEDEEVSSKVDFSNRDLKIFGVLNFAPEKTDEDEEQSSRSPKMDLDLMPKNFSDTFLSSKRNYNSTYLNLLTAEEMKQLAQISKVSDKITPLDGSVGDISFSTKAVSSSSSVNQLTIPLLKKPLNFTNVTLVSDASFEDIECTNTSIVCGDGKCFPATARCNQLIDCKDGKDEENCTCSDYLKSHFLLGKICDGLVDCWDYTDESQCEWCNKDQYVCSNSKECIDQEKICDGIKDCPQGDDESKCVTITSDVKSAQEFEYHSEGFLMVRKYGVWGKLCVDNFENISMQTHLSWQMSDLGKAVCQSMTYQGMDSINIVHDEGKDIKYFELAYFSHNRSKSNLSFRETTCNNKRTVKVKCETLECGARPQILKHIARVVGGNNAGLGAWPWQAALYKEGEFQCGATLLSNRWLVSAGHCFYHSLRDHWVARLGALRRGTALPSPYEQLKTVMNIFVHPGYVDSGYINDISLLQLESPVAFSDYVRPVCLPAAHQLPLDGTLCTIIGWGQLFEVGRIFPDTLQEVQVPIISTAECRKRTLFLPLYKITDDMFCAGYDRGGRDACLGDSGGPLMCPESNGKWTLQGITSNGYGCARANRPGVYTKVANYVDWIQSTINNETNVLNKTRKRSCSGHRCPLGECLSQNRLCNGFIECSDGSDEKNCKNGKKMI